ncbi:MAG TPA: UDP-3-O-(3-hydroxymyristoyl)glucosamine N-acyltransferase [Chthoniobacterales bacterium]|nr:UDP-3-O-(3-hydroxymyristoyl)glucosamine N-acyltransferase [Chthoniobacterales bacterium]
MPYSTSFTAAQIADQLQGEVIGDSSVLLTGFAAANSAKAGDLTVAEKKAYFVAAEQSAATAILVSDEFEPSKKVLIRVPNARIAMAKVLPLFFPPEKHASGIHPSAVLDSTAQIDPSAYIGPHCAIGAGVKIGARTLLFGGNYIGRDSQVGDDCRLYPNVVVYANSQIGHRVAIHAGSVIGSDGYGYVLDEGHHRKMLQVGNVVIHDDVEIGANVAIDRATLGSTVIGQGTKIDNLIQIAHNVVIGRHCIIMGQAGIAGSTHLGDYCLIAAQAGIAGHLKLGHQAMVGATSPVMRDVPDGGKVLGGLPAIPEKDAKRQMIAVAQLPELLRRVRALEKEVEQLSLQRETLEKRER